MIDTLLTPLYYGVTAILLGWRYLLSPVFGHDSGATWALSIVGLVVVIRIILIPLFVKQINSSRKMVALQPKMKALQTKYKGDREKLSQETMKLYKEEKANPFASCLPLLLQSPVFFALFRTLDGAAKSHNGHLTPHGLMSLADATSLNQATLFGAGLSDTFTHAPSATVKVITIILIIAMSATTFTTQRQLTRKNMPASAMTGPMAQQQKLMLYGYPLFFAVTGINFPIGVLLYWLTTNLWTGGQQYYVIKRNPTPGSPAWDEFQAKKKADDVLRRQNGDSAADDGPAVTAPPPAVVRQQPKKTTRDTRRRPSVPGDQTPRRRPVDGEQAGAGGTTATATAKPAAAKSAAAKSATAKSGVKKSAAAKPAGATSAAATPGAGSRTPRPSTAPGTAPRPPRPARDAR